MADEPIIKLPEDIQSQPLPNQLRLSDIWGQFPVTTTVPTDVPKTAQDQIKIYTDSLTSPTKWRLYFYDTANNTWKYSLIIPSAPSNGQLLIGNGTDFTLSTITQGSGVVITNGAGSITIASSGKFGGDGSDGSLTITSGTTTIDAGGAQVVVKQFSSLSITGTGKLAFSNPHANGTWVIIKVQGDVTLTAGSNMIDLSGMGAAGGSGGSATNAGSAGNIAQFVLDTVVAYGRGGSASTGVSAGTAGIAGAQLTSRALYTGNSYDIYRKLVYLVPGSGGGGGGGSALHAGGSGGNGGGALYIECGGALNFTTSNGITVAGGDGTVGDGSSTGGHTGGGGGGGGAGGMALILYNTLTSASGTINSSGGAGGAGGDGNASAVNGAPGGGGAGSYAGAGGIGSVGNTRSPGNGGTSSGGGGGAGRDANAGIGSGVNGGSAGASNNGLILKNTEF